MMASWLRVPGLGVTTVGAPGLSMTWTEISPLTWREVSPVSTSVTRYRNTSIPLTLLCGLIATACLPLFAAAAAPPPTWDIDTTDTLSEPNGELTYPPMLIFLVLPACTPSAAIGDTTSG